MEISKETDFEKAIRIVICRTEPGDILAYGEVAAEAGYPGAARAVGNFLRNSEDLPWWRIVSADGRLHPHGALQQEVLLRSEGFVIQKGKVVLPKN